METVEAFLEIAGNRIHYLAAGQTGPAVILLHGGGVDSALLSWELLIPELAATHRVFAPDFPGYGESDKPDAAYSVDYYIQFLADFLPAVGIETVQLVGISMGGAVAVGFTLANPTQVEKLVLVDSYGLQSSIAFHKLSYLYVRTPGINQLTYSLMRRRSIVRASLKSLLRRSGSITEDLVQKALAEMLRPEAGKAWATFQRSEINWTRNRTCYINHLKNINTPALIVHGTEDKLVPTECAREAHVRIRGSRLHWVDGAGHWPQRDHPKEFNRVVARFLNEPPETGLR